MTTDMWRTEYSLPYYISATSEQGMDGWKAQVRDNYQNFIRKKIFQTREQVCEYYLKQYRDAKIVKMDTTE